MYWTYQKVMSRITTNCLEDPSPHNLSKYLLSYLEEHDTCSVGLSSGFSPTFCTLVSGDFVVQHSLVKTVMEMKEQHGEDIYEHMQNDVRHHIVYSLVQRSLKQNMSRFFLDPYLSDVFKDAVPSNVTLGSLGSFTKPTLIYISDKSVAYEADNKHVMVDSILVLPTQSVSIEKLKEYVASCGKLGANVPVHVSDGCSSITTLVVSCLDVALNEFSTGLYYFVHNGSRLLSDLLEKNDDDVVIKIVANTLLYYTSKDPDILKQLNPDYTKSLNRLKSLTGRARKKRQERLKSIPKNEYYVFGSTLELFRRRQEEDHPDTLPIPSGPQDHKEPGEPTGMKKAAHKVDAHWRWQACGPQWKEHRLTFINSYYTSGHEKEIVGLYVTS